MARRPVGVTSVASAIDGGLAISAMPRLATEDFGGASVAKGHLQTYAARPTRWSISWRSSPKSIGFSPAAPQFGRFPLRRVIAVGVIMITGTFGRAAFTFGSISSPLMPAC